MSREKKRARSARPAVRRRWSSTFPDDILAVVYRMVASLGDRVRFAAVCRSWRAVARGAPPTAAALPWLLLEPCDCSRTKRLHIPEDDAIVWLQLPRGSRRLIGCHDGGWVISTAPLRIVNLFSGAKVTLPEKPAGIFSESKIVFSKPPTSGDCILATVNEHRGIALCRVDGPDSVWTRQRCKSCETIDDITFCNGELYGLTKYNGKVTKFEIGVNEHGAPVVTAEIHLSCSVLMDNIEEKTSYIFDLRGKLAMAIRTEWSLNHKPFFKVFELVDIHDDELAVSDKHTWIEVTSLDDHALFLGQTFSKAVHVPADKPVRVERNHIYYSCCLNQSDDVPSGLLRTFSKGCSRQKYYRGDDRKKDITNDDVKRITSTGYFVRGSPYSSMWILPPDM
ncbi:uncharacterized protein [Aegilops tauschii subsp. strangulata]